MYPIDRLRTLYQSLSGESLVCTTRHGVLKILEHSPCFDPELVEQARLKIMAAIKGAEISDDVSLNSIDENTKQLLQATLAFDLVPLLGLSNRIVNISFSSVQDEWDDSFMLRFLKPVNPERKSGYQDGDSKGHD